MSSGILVVLVIPAILAFIFGVWVLYDIISDVSTRQAPSPTATEPETIRTPTESSPR